MYTYEVTYVTATVIIAYRQNAHKYSLTKNTPTERTNWNLFNGRYLFQPPPLLTSKLNTKQHHQLYHSCTARQRPARPPTACTPTGTHIFSGKTFPPALSHTHTHTQIHRQQGDRFCH